MKKMNVNIKILYKDFYETGMKKKLLDIKVSRSYGWKHKVNLNKGFDITLNDFIINF
jgi:hypothetical protein